MIKRANFENAQQFFHARSRSHIEAFLQEGLAAVAGGVTNRSDPGL